MEKTKDKIIDLVSLTLGIEKKEITLDDDLYADLNAGQLEIADLILKISQAFKIEIETNLIGEIKTVKQLVNLVREKTDGL